MAPAQLAREDVRKSLSMAGELCSEAVTAYLVGGGAMALRGEKLATKDVDIIVESKREADIIGSAFSKVGFVLNDRRPDECRRMIDATVLSMGDGARIDLFICTVCGKLILSKGMKARSEQDSIMGKLRLMVCAREDIFLLKSVTEREKDIEDMFALLQAGIDSKVVLDECDHQTSIDALVDGRIFEAFLLMRLEEIEERFDLSIPWKRDLRGLAERKLGTRLVLGRLAEGETTMSELSKGLGLPRNYLQAIIGQLEEIGKVKVDRSKRPYTITAKE